MTHRDEIAIEVGDDSEAEALTETRQERAVSPKALERVLEEAARDARAGRGVAAEPARHAFGETVHRVAKRQGRRNRSDEGVVHRVEHRIEALRVLHETFVAAE